ncbi:hypothetical protein U27_01608 [Candidatus Vecturithrix granuli]|uniref:Uncharacterized protein n=1 Tax=Vecturithrix granuli TaxID=1499967 RepID=A0A0S6W9A4_VECG1|nr:hypothetical protein U27_01608 [Candidatus Vecturithrix granuli]
MKLMFVHQHENEQIIPANNRVCRYGYFQRSCHEQTLTRRNENRMYREIPFRGHIRCMREKEFRATFS